MGIWCNKHLEFFLTLPPTMSGHTNCAGVSTQKFVNDCTKNVCVFIQNLSHAWFHVTVFEVDKHLVKIA